MSKGTISERHAKDVNLEKNGLRSFKNFRLWAKK